MHFFSVQRVTKLPVIVLHSSTKLIHSNNFTFPQTSHFLNEFTEDEFLNIITNRKTFGNSAERFGCQVLFRNPKHPQYLGYRFRAFDSRSDMYTGHNR